MKSLNQLSNSGVKFVVIKRDETEFWHEDIRAKANKIWTVCLVDLTQPTHLCEIATSYPFTEINHVFEFKEGISENEQNEQLSESEYAELTTGYLHGDSHYKIEKEYNDAEMEFDDCFEYESGNPTVC